jgi:peptidoglycan/xylan/chitin deacetylase (PgdA/CDA1 family)
MKDQKPALSPAHITGIVLLTVAAAAFFVQPLLSVALLFFYIVLCVGACFYPQTNFLGPVISRGRSGKKNVAITFDDGPSEFTTLRILDLLDRYAIRATFFVSGFNAARYPALIDEIVHRGHTVGNHSMKHDPLVMLKSYRVLHREVYEAQEVLHKMGIDTLAFRPPVGIINPKLPSILDRLGLFCVTFSCRAMDAGNFRVKNLSARILKKLREDDIILLHDKPPRCSEDHPVLFQEIEILLTGIQERGFRVVPLAELIDREIMTIKSRT